MYETVLYIMVSRRLIAGPPVDIRWHFDQFWSISDHFLSFPVTLSWFPVTYGRFPVLSSYLGSFLKDFWSLPVYSRPLPVNYWTLPVSLPTLYSRYIFDHFWSISGLFRLLLVTCGHFWSIFGWIRVTFRLQLMPVTIAIFQTITWGWFSVTSDRLPVTSGHFRAIYVNFQLISGHFRLQSTFGPVLVISYRLWSLPRTFGYFRSLLVNFLLLSVEFRTILVECRWLSVFSTDFRSLSVLLGRIPVIFDFPYFSVDWLIRITLNPLKRYWSS